MKGGRKRAAGHGWEDGRGGGWERRRFARMENGTTESKGRSVARDACARQNGKTSAYAHAYMHGTNGSIKSDSNGMPSKHLHHAWSKGWLVQTRWTELQVHRQCYGRANGQQKHGWKRNRASIGYEKEKIQVSIRVIALAIRDGVSLTPKTGRKEGQHRHVPCVYNH